MKHTLKPLAGLVALAFAGSAFAWGDCEHRRDIDESLDLAGSEVLKVIAAAGDLEIVGVDGSTGRVKATVCSSEEDWAEEAGVDLAGGREALVAVVMPDTTSMSWGNKYVYVDLVVEVPPGFDVDVRDSSGDMELRKLGAVVVKDSSGDIDIDGAVSVEVEDSSGDIDLLDVSRDVTVVSDSSGDIRGSDIEGSVVVARDSSGDIRFRDVGGDFLVERDSSGDIEAKEIGGDFAVLRDGSGQIRHSGVSGSVEIPEDG